MGGGSSGKTTSVTNVSENRDPWMGQQPFLSDAFQEAKNTYYQQQAAQDPGYQGDFVAQPQQEQISMMQNLLSGAQGGLTAAQTSANYGSNMAGAGAAGANQASQGLFGIADQAGDLAGKTWDNDGSLGLLDIYAGYDPTKLNIHAAGQYADNPYMSGMVDAAMRDARRTHAEVVTPGIERNAAGTGNINSTRTGIAQGIADRGLAEKTADVSAGLRGQAWSQGLNMADSALNRGLQAATARGQLAQGANALTAGTQLGALNAGAGAYQGAGGIGTDLAKTGLFGIANYGDLLQKSGDVANIANANIAGFNQSPIDNELAKLNYQQAQPWSNLANYWNVVGDKSWGGTVTGTNSAMGTSQQNASTLSSIGAGVGLLGSLFRCDVRVKKNIFPVEGTANGAQLYVFQYKDDPTGEWVVGPLAQEVEAIRPEAIVEINGIKHIDTNLFPWD